MIGQSHGTNPAPRRVFSCAFVENHNSYVENHNHYVDSHNRYVDSREMSIFAQDRVDSSLLPMVISYHHDATRYNLSEQSGLGATWCSVMS